MSEKGRTAYITGGASGIGKAIAEMLVSKGARVFLADINTKGAEAVAAELNKSDPHNAQSTNVDVGDWNSQAKAFGQAVHAFGRIDYVYPIVSSLSTPTACQCQLAFLPTSHCIKGPSGSRRIMRARHCPSEITACSLGTGLSRAWVDPLSGVAFELRFPQFTHPVDRH